jgi:adenine phosphoribosyltransferase
VSSSSYHLEYGDATLERHQDAIAEGTRVLVVDDLLATGGTALATLDLINRLGGLVVGFGFVIELMALEGRARLASHRVEALLAV